MIKLVKIDEQTIAQIKNLDNPKLVLYFNLQPYDKRVALGISDWEALIGIDELRN